MRNSHTATWILMRKIDFQVRWPDMEYMFGVRSFALCEVYLGPGSHGESDRDARTFVSHF